MISMVYNGIYQGTVVSTADPAMKGRLQVSMPFISNGIVGWCMPCRPAGSTSLPVVGATVWVMFEAGNVMAPVWMGVAG